MPNSSYMYHNLPKIGPLSRISPTHFLNHVVAKGAFSRKPHLVIIMPSTCSYVMKEAPKKQLCARGGTNKWRQTHRISKRTTKETLQNHCMCTQIGVDQPHMVGVLSREYHNSWTYTYPPLWGATKVHRLLLSGNGPTPHCTCACLLVSLDWPLM